MKKTILLLALLSFFLAYSLIAGEENGLTAKQVSERILNNSLIKDEREKKSSDLIPKEFTNKELYQLAIELKLADWDLDRYGALGVGYIENAFIYCLYELAKRNEGEIQLIALLENRKLGWDAGHSLILGDAIVKRGAQCIPLLQELPDSIPHKFRYIELIEQGTKTNL